MGGALLENDLVIAQDNGQAVQLGFQGKRRIGDSVIQFRNSGVSIRESLLVIYRGLAEYRRRMGDFLDAVQGFRLGALGG